MSVRGVGGAARALLMGAIAGGMLSGTAWANDAAVSADGSDGAVDVGERVLSVDETRAVVEAAVADAASRASWQSTTPASQLLRITGVVQTRFVGNSGADGGAAGGRGDDDWDSEFVNARTRIIVSGEHPEAPLSYTIAGDFGPEGEFQLIDAYVDWGVAEGWKVRIGQFKGPLTRESDMVSSTRTLFPEVSVAARVFRMNYAQGVQVSREWESIRSMLAFTDGRSSFNSDFGDPATSDAALTLRGEWRIGDAGWRAYRDMTSFRGADTGALLGLAGHWQQGGATGAPAALGSDARLWSYTADASIEGDGWNAMAALLGRTLEGNDESLTDLGFMVQGGAFLSERWEAIARYAHVFPDGDRTGGDDDFSSISVGVNYYLIPGGHAAKLTGEVTWYPDAQGDSASVISPANASGLLRDDDGGQVAIIIQMHLMF
ncbi:MAG: porin [Phycisphaerales bacterium]